MSVSSNRLRNESPDLEPISYMTLVSPTIRPLSAFTDEVMCVWRWARVTEHCSQAYFGQGFNESHLLFVIDLDRFKEVCKCRVDLAMRSQLPSREGFSSDKRRSEIFLPGRS